MSKTNTWLNSVVKIPNCTVCTKWLGSHNSLEDTPLSSNKGYEIIIGECDHAFHGNCIPKHICSICYTIWNPIDKINIGASNWWTVELFWNTYFK